jgi:hypothetical protein
MFELFEGGLILIWKYNFVITRITSLRTFLFPTSFISYKQPTFDNCVAKNVLCLIHSSNHKPIFLLFEQPCTVDHNNYSVTAVQYRVSEVRSYTCWGLSSQRWSYYSRKQC